jgi:integrase
MESSIDAKSGRKMAGKIIGKADSRYWLQSGKLFADPRGNGALSCRIQVQGRREPFPLRTNNKATAAAKAAKIYGDVVAFGWTEALAKHKSEAAKPSKGSTVGELISAVSELSSVRPATLRGYAGALRRIVAEVEGIKANKGRFARCGAGRGAWLTAVDAVALAKLTPDRIEAWKLRYVSSRAGRNETKTRTTRNSANTCLRQAKGLFAKRLLRLISNRIELPTPLPFDGVDFFPRQSMRYTSTMDVGMVIAAARDELAQADPEAFKAFTLCLFAGLRRNEADKLRWQSVDFISGAIRIETQDDFAPKAETSLGDIPIDKELCTILRGLHAQEPRAEYVMAANIEEPQDKLRVARQKALSWSRYRAADTFKRLADWLRAHGVDSRTPLHTLRKEAGSLICQKHGLFAASRFLRHADVGITAQHYAAQKERVTIGLGSLLNEEPENLVEADFSPSKTIPKAKRKPRIA